MTEAEVLGRESVIILPKSRKDLRRVENVEVTLDDLVADNVGDIHVLGITEEGYGSTIPPALKAYSLENWKKLGKEGSMRYFPGADGKVYIVAGLGSFKDWKSGPEDSSLYELTERVRNAVGGAYKMANDLATNVMEKNATLSFDQLGFNLSDTLTNHAFIDAAAYAAVRSGYQYSNMFNPFAEKDSHISQMRILTADKALFRSTFESSYNTAWAENLAQHLFEAPPKMMKPSKILETIQAIAKRHESSLTATYEDRDEILKKASILDGEGTDWAYNALACIAVSSPEAYLVKVSYRGDASTEKTLAWCGKGVVFDTGGYAIKPADGMKDMDGDMGGAATCIGLMESLAAAKAPVNVDFYVPLTYNNIEKWAVTPNDLIPMGRDREGKPRQSIYILNPDAEGRVVLSTAVAKAAEDENTLSIRSIGTLTGAMAISLGPHSYGVIGNRHNSWSKSFADALETMGEVFGQYATFLPYRKSMDDRMTKGIPFGAAVNVGSDRWGSSFDVYNLLNRFKGKVKDFVHLDIAPLLFKDGKREYMPNARFGALPINALHHAIIADYNQATGKQR